MKRVRNRLKIAVIVLSASLLNLFAFQNCSKQFSLQESESSIVVASSDQTDQGNNPPTGDSEPDTGAGTGSGGSTGNPVIVKSPRLSDSQIRDATLATSLDMKCMTLQDYNFTIPSTLQYFGMYPGMSAKFTDFNEWKKYVDPLLKMGNVIFIEANRYDADEITIAELKKRVDYVYQYRMKVILNVQPIFFTNHLIRSDYATLWAKIVSLMTTYYDQGTFVGAYPFDEPFWNAKLKNIPAATMSQSLATVGQHIKSTMPGLNVIFIEAAPMVNSQLEIPDVFDWVGMDCYLEECEGKTTFEYYQTLKNKLKPHQKLAVLPTSMVFKTPDQFTNADSVWMKNQFIKYAEWIANEPKVIASISFLYYYDYTIEQMTGAYHSCHSQDIHRMYARQMSGYKNPVTSAQYTCSGSGPLTAIDLSGNITAASVDRGKVGHFFVAGFDVVRNQWYTYNGSSFQLSNGTESGFTSFPSGDNGLQSLTGTIFTDENLSNFPGGKIYVGYGLGSTKAAAWDEMMAKSRYNNCYTLPQ